jgi:hypothetical protein
MNLQRGFPGFGAFGFNLGADPRKDFCQAEEPDAGQSVEQSLYIDTVILVNQQHAPKDNENDFCETPEGDILPPRQQAADISKPKEYAIASVCQDLYLSAIAHDSQKHAYRQHGKHW